MNIRRLARPFIVLITLILAAMPALAAPTGQVAAQGAVLGSQPWLSILCKFPDSANEPWPLEFFQEMYNDDYYNLGAYWKEVSYGHIDLEGSGTIGWLNLGQSTDYYHSRGSQESIQQALFTDCTALADPSINFDNYVGINLIFNDDIEDLLWPDLFTIRTVTLDGDARTIPVNFHFPWTLFDIHQLAYGMGHGMGLPDSTSFAGPLAENVWDLMDMWNYHFYNEHEFCPNIEGTSIPGEGCVPPHLIAYHKDRLSWIDPERKYVYDEDGGPQTITLERAAQPGPAGYLIALIGSEPNYITIEARNKVAFDQSLPAEGVIIHYIDTNATTPAHLAGDDGGQYSGSNSAVWVPGETFYDNNLSVHIDSVTPSGYVITISQVMVDNHEPNNTTAAATPITYGTLIDNGVIQPTGDEDLYRFSGAAGDVIKIDINAFESGAHLNPTLAVLNAAGSQIAFMDNTPTFFQDPLLYFSLPSAGTYYLRVRDKDHPAEGGRKYWYTLHLENVTGSDPREPNDTISTATPIAIGANITNAYIDRPGDDDYYRFSGTAGDGITLSIRVAQPGVSPGQPVIFLRNSAGSILTSDYGVHDGLAFVSAILPETGNYTIQVLDYMDGWVGGNEYGYTLNLFQTSDSEPGEPNNTRPTAKPITPGVPIDAYIGLPGDIDYYRFGGRTGDEITADIDAETLESFLDSWLGLYNSTGTLLEVNFDENDETNDSLLAFILPTDGTYYLAVRHSNLDAGDLSFNYRLTLSGTTAPPPPPPPTAAFAGTPLSGPAPLTVSFTDQSSDNPTSWAWSFGDGGTSTQQNPGHTYTAPGTYTVSLTATNAQGSDVETRTAYITVSPPPPSPSLYVSSLTAGTAGGVAITPQDILFRNGAAGTWSMHFDGSDVGVTKALTAFARLANGDLLLVLKANQTLPGIGLVTPWDIVRFTPTSLGANTAGTFAWYVDGSDVGLTAAAEKIDALDVLSDGRVLISTGGALAVPKSGGGTLKSQDEDLTALTPTALGATTAGTWALYFDGTAVTGLGAEDLVGAHVDEATGDIYIGILGAFKVDGITGSGKDILRLQPSGSGHAATLYWRGSQQGFNLNLGGTESN